MEFGWLEFGDGKRVEVKKSSVVVGRNGDVEILDEAVSKRHLELRREEGGFAVKDLGSTNGTTVDGEELAANVEVLSRWGSEVILSPTVGKIRFKIMAPEVPKPQPRQIPAVSFMFDGDKAARPVPGHSTKQKAPQGVQEGRRQPEVATEVSNVSTGSLGAPVAKRRGRRKGLTIVKRDLEVLQWLAEHRWSTWDLLVAAFYAEPNLKMMTPGRKPSGKYGRERLWALERKGLIQPSSFTIGSVAPLLLSSRGYDLLHGQGLVEWAHPFPDINPATVEHERLSQDLEIKLRRLGATNWRTERLMSWTNRVNQLPFVPDAKFEAGGFSWNLEIERTLKAKDRRKKAFEVRSNEASERFLYVVPDSIWGAVKDSMPATGFEGGIYWLRESDFRQGRLTVKCKLSARLDWTDEMPLENLLRGEFEPERAQRRKNSAVAYATEEMRKEFSDVARAVRSHIGLAQGVLKNYATKLATRRKGFKGIGAEKIDPPKFPSCGELTERFGVMTLARRKWRESHDIELEAFKSLEQAFKAYAGQLRATEEDAAKSIAAGQPQGYGLPKADELEKALSVLNPR